MNGNSSIPADDRAEIMRRLDRATEEHRARILLAVESGSRAWGFPSPDSDYDVRFLYVLPAISYLGLTSPRDVIEQPIEGLFDINGWDLRKALNLLLKANPVLVEWTRSPIVYAEEDGFRAKLEGLLEQIDERPSAQHHHSSILKSHYKQQIADEKQVKLKRYFYCLRPAYALRWMWENPKGALPMQFSELRSGVAETDEHQALVDSLLRQKAETRELGVGDRIAVLDAFIEDTIRIAESADFPPKAQPDSDLVKACESLLLDTLGQ